MAEEQEYINYNQSMLSMVIQAGGESRRMGQDKALRTFLGRPLIQRVVQRVAGISAEILVTTNRPEAYRFLGLRLVEDLIPGRGALGGLYTALSAARFDLVAVVACDMPFANPDLLAAERDLLIQETADVVIPQTTSGTEPFHAIYRRPTCLPHIQAALEEERWRVDSWFPSVKLIGFGPEETARYDPQGMAFWNVNTPEEFARAERIAKGSEV